MYKALAAALIMSAVPMTLSGCAETPSSQGSTDAADRQDNASLECPEDLVERGEITYTEYARGSPGEPVDVVEDWLHETLVPSDQLDEMGDTSQRLGDTHETVAISRDGATIALVHLTRRSNGDLAISSFEGCAGLLRFP